MRRTQTFKTKIHGRLGSLVLALSLLVGGCDRPPAPVSPGPGPTGTPVARSAEGTPGAEGAAATEVAEPAPGPPAQAVPEPPDNPYAGSPAEATYRDAVRVLEQGEVEDGVAMLREAVRVDPEHVPAWSLLFELVRDGSDPELAAEACAGLLDHATYAGWEAAQLELDCAMANLAADRLDEAERLARRSVEDAGGRLEPVVTLSGILLRAERPEDVVELLAGAVRVPGGDLEASALSNLGAAYLMLERLDEAVATFELALEQSPGRADLLLNLADALHRANRDDEAREVLGRVLASNPEDERARQRLSAWGLSDE